MDNLTNLNKQLQQLRTMTSPQTHPIRDLGRESRHRGNGGNVGSTLQHTQRLSRPFEGYVELGKKVDVLNFFRGNKSLSSSDYVSHLESLFNFSFTYAEASEISSAVSKLRSRAKSISKSKGGHTESIFEPTDAFHVKFQLEAGKLPTTSKRAGKPEKEYTAAAASSKRRKLKEAVVATSNVPLQELIIKIVKTSSLPNRHEMQQVFQYCLGTPGKLRYMVERMRDKQCNKDPIKITAERALSHILDYGLTVNQYKGMRNLMLSHNSNTCLPSYQQVLAAKAELRPPKSDVEITESYAKIKLQALLNLTCRRFLEMTPEVMNSILSQHDSKNFVMQVSWGFDGTTGQANYKMQLRLGGPRNPSEESEISRPLSDSSLFVCSMIPLQIVQKGINREEDGRILWRNAVPQSIRFCRPISLEFAKETSELIRRTKESIDSQISQLTPFQYTYATTGVTVNVKFECYLTIIDGKALNVITQTDSSMACPICHSTPKTFNNLTNVGTSRFAPKSSDNLKHGINSMHAYIRFLELVLHIAYRKDIKKWQARRPQEKMSVASNKSYFQKELYENMGLLIDFPAAGGSGNSNDGNTSRTAFKRYEEFGSILEFDVELLNRFRIILISLNHNYALDSEKFGDYCLQTAHLYTEKYPWYYMSATLHKVLIHGKEIIESSALPLGMLSEHAGESRNKYYLRDRHDHARKTSRIDNMNDMIFRGIDSSDPIASSMSLSEKQKKLRKDPLPPEAIELLLAPPSPQSTINDELDVLPRELFPEELGSSNDGAAISYDVQLINEEEVLSNRANSSDEVVLNEMEEDTNESLVD